MRMYGHKANARIGRRSSTYSSARASDFSVGDSVTVTGGRERGLTGTVVFVGSGPGSDQVSVELDHPVQRMMGPVIIEPRNLSLRHRSRRHEPNPFDPTQDYDDYAPARGHAEDTSQSEIERAQAEDDYERFVARLDGPPEDVPSFEEWWRTYRMNARRAHAPNTSNPYNVQVGDAVQFRFEPGTGGVVRRLEEGVAWVTTTRGVSRKVPADALRQVHASHQERTRSATLLPNSSHRERAASVLGGGEDPGAGTPIANASEVDFFEDNRFVREGPLWKFQFGAYGTTNLYVWADSMDSGFEVAVEWLDDHAPGMLTMVSEEDYQRAAEELGKTWDPSEFDDEIAQEAEADMTMIGHTTLKHGNAVASWEWHASEVTKGSPEWDEVVERSREESGEYQENASPDEAILDSAERTAENTGQWKGELEGVSVWIGEPGGSRTHQWEAQVLKDGIAVELRSRKFSALKKQILRAVKST